MESRVVVHPRASVVWQPAILERYRNVSPATIGHLLEDGFMDPAIKPLGRRVKLVGPALTLFQLPGRSGMLEAIEAAQPGDALVVDRGGERKRATFGEMLAIRCMRAGLAGVVIDGPATDIIELQDMGFPVFSRGVSALLGPSLAKEATINAPVSCGGVVVRPGDLILGDDNGVVVIPPERAEAILEAAEARERDEAARRSQAQAWLKS